MLYLNTKIGGKAHSVVTGSTILSLTIWSKFLFSMTCWCSIAWQRAVWVGVAPDAFMTIRSRFSESYARWQHRKICYIISVIEEVCFYWQYFCWTMLVLGSAFCFLKLLVLLLQSAFQVYFHRSQLFVQLGHKQLIAVCRYEPQHVWKCGVLDSNSVTWRCNYWFSSAGKQESEKAICRYIS